MARRSDKASPKVLLSAGMIQGGHSGVGRYVRELASRLARRQDLCLHVAGLEKDRGLFDLEEDRWITIPRHFQKGAANLAWHQVFLPHLLRRYEIDLVHIPSYRRLLVYSPCLQLGTIHDCAPFHLRNKYGVLRGIFGRSLTPWLAQRCDAVSTVSEATRQDLSYFYGLRSADVRMIHNGIDHQRYRPLGEEQLQAFRNRWRLDSPFLIYVSRLEHPGKNHLRLIQAYEKLRQKMPMDLKLVLAGAPWAGAEVITKRINCSPFKADIVTPGFVDEEDLPKWYGCAQALVFPSLFEGFGLPVAEAMACGCRVISSDRGSLREVGGEAATYFDPQNTASLLEALKDLVTESEAVRQDYRKRGLFQAAHFDWDRCANETAGLILELIDERRRGG